MLDNPEPMICIPRHLDPVPQPWQDRLQEKLWRARVALNEKNRAAKNARTGAPAFFRMTEKGFSRIDWTLDGE